MTAVAKTSALRDAHRDLTRTRILDAAIALLSEDDLEALTVAGVAARAGMTERTVYRHFATREDMIAAVWPKMQTLVGSPGFPKTVDDLVAQPGRLFPAFDKHQGAVRASVYSRAGRELRMSVNEQRQDAMRACVREAWPDLAEPELTRLAAVVQLLDSAYAWAVMKEFWGLSGEESARAASDAIAVLLGVRPAGAKSQNTKKGKAS